MPMSAELEPNAKLAELTKKYSDQFLPIDIVQIGLRSYGLDYDPALLNGRRNALFLLQSNEHEASLGLRNNQHSMFSFDGENLTYGGDNVAFQFSLLQRGWRPDFYFKGRCENEKINEEAVLNINFSQFCNNRCAFCVRTYMDDDPKNYNPVTENHIKHIIKSASKLAKGNNLSKVEQISVVSGLKSDQNFHKDIGQTLKTMYKTAKQFGFEGKFMYAGYQLGDEDIDLISKTIPDFSWFYTIEAFQRRQELMPSPKGKKSVEEIAEILLHAQQKGLSVSFFYIAGIDDLSAMERSFKILDFVNLVPNVNLFDVYNHEEERIRDNDFFRNPYDYLYKTARLVTQIFNNGVVPDRGRLDNSAGLWAQKLGLFQPDKAYVIGDYWREIKQMGPQGKVKIID